MNKKISIGVLMLAVCGLVACQEQEESSISSSIESSSTNSESISSTPLSSDTASTQSIISSLSSEESFESSSLINDTSTSNEESPKTSTSNNESSSSNDTSSLFAGYYPINPTPIEDVFSTPINYELSMNKITQEVAEELVANDILKYPEEQAPSKRTIITSVKEESHVTENRSDATYSVKDIVKEKHAINKIDSNLKWSYRKSQEDTITTYFVEDPLVRHTTIEQLVYVKDNCLYRVFTEKSYYEGMEDRGTYEAYYYKTEDYDDELYGANFVIPVDGYTYFSGAQGFNKLDKTILNNFRYSSSFYEADNYSALERDTDYEYYSSGESGSFGCIAKDIGDYHFSDLIDYPSMERESLHTISYQQDYLLNISNYFTFEEDYLTKSVSKKSNGHIIRNEMEDGRKKVTQECEAFYPDLSNFEERENNPITR